LYHGKGQATATDGTNTDGCYWRAENTALGIGRSLGTLSGVSDGVQEKDLSGFPAEERYDDNLDTCSIAIQVGADGLRIDLANTGNQNQALAGKGCTVAEDIAQKALAKIKK
jgi:hypothetical protein